MKKFVLKALGIGGGANAALTAVIFSDLDGKSLFDVLEIFIMELYDNMERKDMLTMPYDMDKFPAYKYDEI